MSSRRTLILIGALLLGGLAAFLTLNYVRGVENRVSEDTELIEVVVAQAPVAEGTQASAAIADGSLAVAERARQDVPANAVSRLADVEGEVAAIDLSGGEIVTSTMFAGIQDLTGSRSASLDPGNVAITVNVDSASVSGGLIQPGDRVNLLVRFQRTATAAGDTEGGEGDTGETSLGVGDGGVIIPKPAGYAFQAVKVFAVGTDAGTAVADESADGEAEGGATENLSTFLTLQMPPEDAALLASVRDAELFASLVPPDYEPRPIEVIGDLPALPGMEGRGIYEDENAGQ